MKVLIHNFMITILEAGQQNNHGPNIVDYLKNNIKTLILKMMVIIQYHHQCYIQTQCIKKLEVRKIGLNHDSKYLAKNGKENKMVELVYILMFLKFIDQILKIHQHKLMVQRHHELLMILK